ncbi:hypothetical protein KC19_11G158900 [Ceratodon purpureus]|uniref:Uncharacterized protein n=1 Tax=Ceratodon purpureus TaxID=3225 RepID=A0A8T0GGT2_CERPU|nr:hypothetical protein KC19_11G158900 [Ceratodon purpureus]KAG0557812.1 hypothetical protein KC19_11G158900 [Ceratodon purpureus]KAG0557813.1 hypothetical protein KC19_11G158900 [Ceratodon purpureus]KAG0557814.1 hypothetical protein KC19_11G158900 [Ceratodon purpureus]KAG0557815.1 hypothetical protein KC19_11G158900 [Ceratodon purpureus]
MDNERYSSVISEVEYSSLDPLMQRGLNKFYEGDYKGALDDFIEASERNPRCAHTLKCVAMMWSLIVGGNEQAVTLFRHAEITSMNSYTSAEESPESAVFHHILKSVGSVSSGEVIQGCEHRVVFEEQTLSPRPKEFKSESKASQKMYARLQFLSTMRRNGNDFEVALKITGTRHGVNECLKENYWTGPFIHELRLEVSPVKFDSKHVTASPGDESSADHVVHRTTGNGLSVQLQGSAAPSGSITGTKSNSTSTSVPKFEWDKSNAVDDKWLATWRINTLKNGEPFDLSKKPKWKVPELAGDPTNVNHNLGSKIPPFECKWVVSNETAHRYDFKFQWKVTLTPKIAYVPRWEIHRALWPKRAHSEEEKFDRPVIITSDFKAGLEKMFVEKLKKN